MNPTFYVKNTDCSGEKMNRNKRAYFHFHLIWSQKCCFVRARVKVEEQDYLKEIQEESKLILYLRHKWVWPYYSCQLTQKTIMSWTYEWDDYQCSVVNSSDVILKYPFYVSHSVRSISYTCLWGSFNHSVSLQLRTASFYRQRRHKKWVKNVQCCMLIE